MSRFHLPFRAVPATPDEVCCIEDDGGSLVLEFELTKNHLTNYREARSVVELLNKYGLVRGLELFLSSEFSYLKAERGLEAAEAWMGSPLATAVQNVIAYEGV